MKYKPRVSLVNGDIINDLLELCNEYFDSYMVQPYAGASRECIYCGATEQKNGGAHHSAADCPIMKYMDIAEKHKRFIVKKITKGEDMKVKIKTFAEIDSDHKTTTKHSDDLEYFIITHDLSPATFTDKLEDALPKDRIIEITEHSKHMYQWYDGKNVYLIDDWLIDDNYITEDE